MWIMITAQAVILAHTNILCGPHKIFSKFLIFHIHLSSKDYSSFVIRTPYPGSVLPLAMFSYEKRSESERKKKMKKKIILKSNIMICDVINLKLELI